MSLVIVEFRAPVATITLNDPDRRNALSTSMFASLEAAIDGVARHDPSIGLRLRGSGSAFCAGFDLAACVEDPTMLADLIRRLSVVNRKLRRLRQVVIAEVQGAALAGGCALLSACDFVCVAPDAQLGYPVHRIGVSPAVSLPTLLLAVGGAARPLTLSGDIIDGRAALDLGLATHCAEPGQALSALVDGLGASLARKGPAALTATKAWLNELDGSDRDRGFDRTMEGSAELCGGDECVTMLRTFWESRKR